MGSPQQRISPSKEYEAAKSGIPKRKKTKTYPRLSCKIEYLLTSNHSDGSIASEFFTGDEVAGAATNKKAGAMISRRLVFWLEPLSSAWCELRRCPWSAGRR